MILNIIFESTCLTKKLPVVPIVSIPPSPPADYHYYVEQLASPPDYSHPLFIQYSRVFAKNNVYKIATCPLDVSIYSMRF